MAKSFFIIILLLCVLLPMVTVTILSQEDDDEPSLFSVLFNWKDRNDPIEQDSIEYPLSEYPDDSFKVFHGEHIEGDYSNEFHGELLDDSSTVATTKKGDF